MRSDEHADFDGDGRFDGVDISIMEDDSVTRRPINNNGGCGCCVMLFVLGSAFGCAGWWSVTNYLIS